MILGIDASNIRIGGGITYLAELLKTSKPKLHGISKIIIWAPKNTLEKIEDRDWLIKRSPKIMERNFIMRAIWQRFQLSPILKSEGCDILFVPGGTFATNFRPIVTASTNLLPFQWKELLRYGLSFSTLKLMILRYTQTWSYKNSNGIIFLSQYARDVVLQVSNAFNVENSIIPFGINERFFKLPRRNRLISAYNSEHPFHILYASSVEPYKHQLHLLKAVANLRNKTGWPINLDFIGPSQSKALRRLQRGMMYFDPNNIWASYHGTVHYDELHEFYQNSDLGVFASSCENLPNTLLETMAAGLPIASSNRGPMPEILQETGVYFDPEKPEEITEALFKLIDSPDLRTKLANLNYQKARKFSWENCSAQSLSFFSNILKASVDNNSALSFKRQ